MKGVSELRTQTASLRIVNPYMWVCVLGNRKGCDIGYAPAISSCEEANSVDTCTVAALDVITAFAVPNPNCPSQDQSVFSGLVALQVALTQQITQPTSDW